VSDLRCCVQLQRAIRDVHLGLRFMSQMAWTNTTVGTISKVLICGFMITTIQLYVC
jgi:hypothetical protein